jgi:hypothetical protein
MESNVSCTASAASGDAAKVWGDMEQVSFRWALDPDSGPAMDWPLRNLAAAGPRELLAWILSPPLHERVERTLPEPGRHVMPVNAVGDEERIKVIRVTGRGCVWRSHETGHTGYFYPGPPRSGRTSGHRDRTAVAHLVAGCGSRRSPHAGLGHQLALLHVRRTETTVEHQRRRPRRAVGFELPAAAGREQPSRRARSPTSGQGLQGPGPRPLTRHPDTETQGNLFEAVSMTGHELLLIVRKVVL